MNELLITEAILRDFRRKRPIPSGRRGASDGFPYFKDGTAADETHPGYDAFDDPGAALSMIPEDAFGTQDKGTTSDAD